ncbi:MAG: hypothetical protein ACFFCT_01205 [Candidatus Odinarchaeota archaeon]
MIQLNELHDLKWFGLSIFVAIFGLKLYLVPDDILGIAISGAGLALYSLALFIHLSSKTQPRVLWDEERGIVSIIRQWTIEVTCARVLSSVPIGIDLSHSGRKVLQSMYTRFSNCPGGYLVFFIIRPVDNRTTRVGYLVRRSGLKLWKGLSQVNSLSNKVVTDIMILERAMRAAYPHLPVENASFQDIIATCTGGLETHAVI